MKFAPRRQVMAGDDCRVVLFGAVRAWTETDRVNSRGKAGGKPSLPSGPVCDGIDRLEKRFAVWQAHRKDWWPGA